MWCPGRTSGDTTTGTMQKSLPETIVKKPKVKHSQSATKCDCYKSSPDKNLERNYILSFLTKTLPQQRETAKNERKSKNKSESGGGRTGLKNKKIKKDALKKANSITFRRNRIIPLNDGSGGCVLVSQTTTIKETSCGKEEKKEANKTEGKKEEKGRCTPKRRFSELLRRISTLKSKTNEYLFQRKMKSSKKIEKGNPTPVQKTFVEFEKVPAQDDFVEECFDEEDEPVVEHSEESEPGRLSACSSGYFTPVGKSPSFFRRGSSARRAPLSRPESVEEFEEVDSESVHSRSVSAASSVAVVESIRKTLDAAGAPPRRRRSDGEPLYPNCDSSIWMRTCSKELVEPIRGTTSGMIPVWLKGSLLRNGPGSMQVGDMTFKHLFDSSALLHRFAINNGEVTYQCRFLRSKTYLKNHAANRIVVNEFGTKSVPDPCKTIFNRVSALFDPGESISDNALISCYPFGDEFYCFTESPTIHRIDPTTLETLERVNLSKHVAVVNHTSHPHVTRDGTVYNQAMSVQRACPHYSIVKFPGVKRDDARSKDKSRPGQMFERAEIVASVRARWPLNPAYMHTFGLTDNYYVIVEQPLSISVPNMAHSQLFGQPMSSCFRFFKDKNTLFHVVERESGRLHRTYQAEAFFYLHIVNQFETVDQLVIDICCYSDPAMLDCMYYEALKDLDKNPDFARMFRGRPLRFVLPLAPGVSDGGCANLVTLPGSAADARWRGAEVFVRPELICDLGCETPRISYAACLGKPYRYFYAISSDVDIDNPGTLIKVDTHGHTAKTWGEPGLWPSEPIFIPSPHPQAEDDGVVVSALIWGKERSSQAGMLVLDATSWTELGRAVFQTPSPVPKCLHGWFTPDF